MRCIWHCVFCGDIKRDCVPLTCSYRAAGGSSGADSGYGGQGGHVSPQSFLPPSSTQFNNSVSGTSLNCIDSVPFCSSAVLDPRVSHIMDVLSLFVFVLCHSGIVSSTGIPIHVLMLSIQALHCLPRLRAPGIVPCIVSFSGQLPCFLVV